MGTKSQYISVATTSEGFHDCRVVTGNIPTAPPQPFPTYTKLWIAGSSCELMQWPLNANGNVAPTMNIQGAATDLTGPLGDNDSFTYAIDIDQQGYQYALTYWQLTPSGVQYAVCVFAPSATGNVAPVRRFIPTNLATLTSELPYGGLCVDYDGHCYVGIYDASTGNNYIYKFSTVASGSVTGTIFAEITSTDPKGAKPGFTSLCYDPVRKWIWATINASSAGASSGIIAYDLNGVQQVYMTPAVLGSPTQVFIGPDGSIWIGDISTNAAPFPAAILEFALNASVASRELTVTDNSWSVDYLGVGVDQNGIIYVSTGHGQTSKFQTFPANSNGDVTGTQLTQVEGAATYLSTMISGAATWPAQVKLSA